MYVSDPPLSWVASLTEKILFEVGQGNIKIFPWKLHHNKLSFRDSFSISMLWLMLHIYLKTKVGNIPREHYNNNKLSRNVYEFHWILWEMWYLRRRKEQNRPNIWSSTYTAVAECMYNNNDFFFLLVAYFWKLYLTNKEQEPIHKVAR